MGYGSISGHARTDATNPHAFAVCDRCARWFNHVNLRWQFDYRGRQLANIRILVCDSCYDEPQPQLLPRIIPPDPVPIQNARTEYFEQYETNNRVTEGVEIDFFTGLPIARQGNLRVTENYNNRVTQQTGASPGNRNLFPGVRFMVPGDGVDDIPYGTPGVPNTGLITEEDRYSVWTSALTNPMYFANDAGFEMYWGGEQVQPEPDVNGIRLTQAGEARITQDGRVRDISVGAIVLEGRTTSDGSQRITQDLELRGSLVAVSTVSEGNGNG